MPDKKVDEHRPLLPADTAAWRPIRTARAGPPRRPPTRSACFAARNWRSGSDFSRAAVLYGVGLLSFSPDGELCVTAHEKGRPANAVSFVMLNIEREDARTLFVWSSNTSTIS